MPKIQQSHQEINKTQIPKRIFTDQELKDFHEYVQTVKTTHTNSKGDTESYIDWISVHKNKKTLSPEGIVYLQIDDFGDCVFPCRFQKLEDKIEQYLMWIGKKEFIRKIENSEFEKLVEQIKLK